MSQAVEKFEIRLEERMNTFTKKWEIETAIFMHAGAGLDGVVEVRNGFRGFREINTVTYDPSVVTETEMEEALKKAHEALERQYAERTRELEETNLRKKAIFDLYSIFELIKSIVMNVANCYKFKSCIHS